MGVNLPRINSLREVFKASMTHSLKVFRQVLQSHLKINHLPTAAAWPLAAASMMGDFPVVSQWFTRAPWLSNICIDSHWSLKAAACKGVLQNTENQSTDSTDRALRNTEKILMFI